MRLVILPSFCAFRQADGKVVLTRKFISGVEEYLRHWDGAISVILEPAAARTDNLDEVLVDPSELEFGVEVISYDSPDLKRILSDVSIVLGAVGHRQNHLASLCRSLGVPLIYVTEYSLQTRWQIVRADVSNPLKRLRKYVWEYSQERRQARAISLCPGVQCNGTPTYQAYRSINPSPLLYFDTRVAESLVATEDEVRQRYRPGPLRLMFSGRLIQIKGADELIAVAEHLRNLGTDFEMTICGGGVLEASMRREIASKNLTDRVKLTGVLDFQSELVPLVKQQCDLFVCCHRQGDPSCTYLETMSCGTPIIGYDNEAWAGLLNHAGAGWITPMNQPKQMAAKIAELSRDRAALMSNALKSLAFAREHTFEKTFVRRIEHLKSLAQMPKMNGISSASAT